MMDIPITAQPIGEPMVLQTDDDLYTMIGIAYPVNATDLDTDTGCYRRIPTTID